MGCGQTGRREDIGVSDVIDLVARIGDGLVRAVGALINSFLDASTPGWLVPPPPHMQRRCAYCGQVFQDDRKGPCRYCGAPEE
jgi:hypothetical protein